MFGTIGDDVDGSVRRLAVFDQDLRRSGSGVVACNLAGRVETHEDPAVSVAGDARLTGIRRLANGDDLNRSRGPIDTVDLPIRKVRVEVGRHEQRAV